ncbi:hypothetical protein [Cellulosimicrobium composti]|uniref:Integral membrane protein n=1 Tax=Cellulosimicrobium composti TaxID=2672572 RepID=A0ABX0BCZ9_9MICO|nr:hypothetical protein [Cellulosimicrobium composti]NDO88834.1 hypothetical protein [Cellulosimicrobium composti]TWG78338.1 hypothetical protein L603_000500001190 [Cellulosimicrobium cellulans J34]SMF06103.1 hypothetical protein SAMN02744115_01183 [Cellulosimicrobium cellulans J1]
MEILYNVFLTLHFVGWAVVLGGYLASLRTPGLYTGVLHGALTALVAGIAMVGVGEASVWETWPNGGPDMAKIAVKLTVALVISVLAFVAKRQGSKAADGAVAPGLKHAIGGLTLVNILVAVFWN